MFQPNQQQPQRPLYAPPGMMPQGAAPTDMVLGRWRIMDVCTTGGFGDVLICWDTRLQRRVAIKRIALGDYAAQSTNGEDAGYGAYPHTPYQQGSYQPNYTPQQPLQQQFQQPFQQQAPAQSAMDEALAEARMASMLSHPNIVTMYDFETDDAYAYLVMEYIDGITLSELLSRVENGCLTGDEACYVTDAICSAVACAHENRVLHLDIKPANIMFDHTGRVKLCDFGMATLASAAGYGDARGGTVGYMPLEQIEGDLVDERSDIFSLACVIWQSLTSVSPFAAQDAEHSLKLIEKGPKPPLSSYHLDIPAVSQTLVEQTLTRALAPYPQTRLAHVDELKAALCSVLGDAQAGKRSIQHLVEQALADDETDDETIKEKLPITFRYPWLGGVLSRAITCALSLPFVIVLCLTLNMNGWVSALLCAACVAAGIWWQAGCSLIGIALGAFALISSPSILSLPGITLLLLYLICAGGWWYMAGCTSEHSAIYAYAPTISGARFISCILTPRASTPIASVVHLVWSTLWSMCIHALLVCTVSGTAGAAGINAEAAGLFLAHCITPSFVCALAWCAAACALSTYIYQHKYTKAWRITAQLIATCGFIASYVCCGTASLHEAFGVWQGFGIWSMIIAVCLSVLMLIFTSNTSTHLTHEEVDSGSELN